MDYFKKFISLIMLCLTCFCSAEVQMKDENGKYRHYDPEVREEFLAIADALRSHKMYPKTEKLLKTLTSKWSKAGYGADLGQACERLFYTLLRSDRLGQYETVMRSCPDDQVRSYFLKVSNSRDIVNTIFLYDFLRESWNTPESNQDLIKICRTLKKQFSRRRFLKKHATSPNDCSGLNDKRLRLELAQYYLKKSQQSEHYQAERLLQQYLMDWGFESNEIEGKGEACVELTVLYLKSDTPERVDSLVDVCSANNLRKGRILWLSSNVYVEENYQTGINAASSFIGQWLQPEHEQDLFRACQVLQWLLIKQGNKQGVSEYKKLCPVRDYTLAISDAGMSSLMEGYLANFPGRPIKRIPPRYPQIAQERGLDGYALIEFIVTREGEIQDPVVIEGVIVGSNGEMKESKMFNKESLKAIKKMEFEPRLVNGIPQEYITTFKFVFEMGNEWHVPKRKGFR